MEQIAISSFPVSTWTRTSEWWSICSAHGAGRRDPNCSACNTGRWINPWEDKDEGFDPGKFVHFDGSPANPFPRLRMSNAEKQWDSHEEDEAWKDL